MKTEEELEIENARLRQAYDYIIASRNNVDKELDEANDENNRLRKIVEAAFVAGRSKTTWKQFKKDNDL